MRPLARLLFFVVVASSTPAFANSTPARSPSRVERAALRVGGVFSPRMRRRANEAALAAARERLAAAHAERTDALQQLEEASQRDERMVATLAWHTIARRENIGRQRAAQQTLASSDAPAHAREAAQREVDAVDARRRGSQGARSEHIRNLDSSSDVPKPALEMNRVWVRLGVAHSFETFAFFSSHPTLDIALHVGSILATAYAITPYSVAAYRIARRAHDPLHGYRPGSLAHAERREALALEEVEAAETQVQDAERRVAADVRRSE